MGMLEIKYHGQSCFTLQTEDSRIIIDPGKKKLGNIKGDIVFVTHKHADHTAGVKRFLRRNTDSVLICNNQVADEFKTFDDSIILATPGEEINHGEWRFKFIKGTHGLFRNIENTGVIIEASSLCFGHAGDSVEFQNFSQEKIDIFAIPISGIVTASPKRALKELGSFKQPLPIIVPIHWLIRNPSKFCTKLTNYFPKSQCIVPKVGEYLDY